MSFEHGDTFGENFDGLITQETERHARDGEQDNPRDFRVTQEKDNEMEHGDDLTYKRKTTKEDEGNWQPKQEELDNHTSRGGRMKVRNPERTGN